MKSLSSGKFISRKGSRSEGLTSIGRTVRIQNNGKVKVKKSQGMQLHSFQASLPRTITNKRTNFYDYREGVIQDIIQKKNSILNHRRLAHLPRLRSNTEQSPLQQSLPHKSKGTHNDSSRNLKNFIDVYFKRKSRQEARDKQTSLLLQSDFIVAKRLTGKLLRLPPVMMYSIQF